MGFGLIVSMISTALITLAMISMWVSFSILPDGYSCTDKDFKTNCTTPCISDKLPGEAESLLARSEPYKYELAPYYLGDRTCKWFDDDPQRCFLPTKGDICFDLVTWKDKKGKDCEVWTKYIRSKQGKDTDTSSTQEKNTDTLYSPRELGDNEHCHKAPDHYPNMSSTELQDMRRACCVCGAHRDERNYQGSLSKKHTGSFQQAQTPPQHSGKDATHMTQCCSCDVRGKVTTKDESDNIRKRGGTWRCRKTKNGKTTLGENFIMGKRDVTRSNIEISAIILSVASVLSLALLLYMFSVNTKEAGDNGDSDPGATTTTDDPEDLVFDTMDARFLLRL